MNFYNNPKKSLGQNFLIDKNIVNKIINILQIKKDENILEIGPGYGILTNKILETHPKKFIAIEKDKKLVEILKKKIINDKKINIINDDIFNHIKKNTFGKNIIVLGNLPYNISTQILASLVLLKKWPPWYKILVFMFQKEVADRIIAKKNSSNFGRLSVLCNWRLDIKKHFDVSFNCFYPKPKINSTVLSFRPKMVKYYIKNPKNLEMITRVLFNNRRKMINKNFLKLFNNDQSVAKELQLNLNLRPAELSNEMFYKITMKYEKLFS